MYPIYGYAEFFRAFKKVEFHFAKMGKLCVITGQNGVGKSSLIAIDAVTKYGESVLEEGGIESYVYGVSDKDGTALTGKPPVTKLLMIYSDDEYYYRVLRTFNINKKSGGHTLLFQRRKVGALETWDANAEGPDGNKIVEGLNGQSIKDTQKKINDVFGNYVTNMSATMLYDGKNMFLDSREEVRGDVSGYFFGCERSEERKKVATDTRKEKETLLAAEKGAAAVYLGKTDKEPETILECDKARAELNVQEKTLKDVKDLLSVARSRSQSMFTELAKTEEQTKVYAETKAQIDKLETKKTEIELALESKDEIYGSVKELAEVKAKIKEANDTLLKRAPLEKEVATLKAKVDQEAVKRRQELKGYSAQMMEEAGIKSEIEKGNKKLAELAGQLAPYVNAEKEAEDAHKASNELSGKSAKLEAEIAELDGRIVKLRQYHAAIKSAKAHCPMCERDFSKDEERLKALNNIQKEGTALAADMAAKKGEKTKVLSEVAQAAERYNVLILKVKEKEKLITESARSKDAVARIEADLKAVNEIKIKHQKVKLELESVSFMQAENTKIAQINEQLAGLACCKNLEELETRQKTLLPYEGMVSVLENAARDTKAIEDELAGARAKQKSVEGAAVKEAELRKQIEATKGETESLEKEESEKGAIVAATSAKIAGYETVLEDIKKAKVLLKDNVERQAKLAKEAAIMTVLEKAYDVRGVPQMLYNKYLPALSSRINGVLDTMCQGWSVEISASINSRGKFMVPVMTYAPNGTVKKYLARSGGERFMVALAFMLGLSLFWSDRTGCKLGSVYVDEGFGKTDDVNINAALAAISQAVALFKLVILITHRKELIKIGEVQVYVYNDGINGAAYTIGGTPGDIPMTYRTYSFTHEGGRAVDASVSIVKEAYKGASDSRAVEMLVVSGASKVAEEQRPSAANG